MGLWFDEKDASTGAKISGSIPIRVTLCVFPSHRGGSRVLPKTQKKKKTLTCRGKKMKHLNQRLMRRIHLKFPPLVETDSTCRQ